MKVLLLNGSTRKNGCTWLALSEIAKTLQDEGIETEIVQLGAGPVRDCIGCNGCQGKGRCVFGDYAEPRPEYGVAAEMYPGRETAGRDSACRGDGPLD